MTVVVANGVFDLVHEGHRSLLQFASQQGDRLIVLINSDDSTRRLKGRNRPAWSSERRREALLSVPGVDQVLIFGEDTPERLLAVIRPNVLVKGADNVGKRIPGAQYCGRVKFAPTVPGVSTTLLIGGDDVAKASAD